MKRYQVRLLELAKTNIEEIAAWWSTHRPKHPDLPAEELRSATRTLAGFPNAGGRVQSRRARGIRRLLLPRSQYWIYYEVDEDLEEVRIFAVWRTARGKKPPFK